jgi:hypothetical protein
MKRNANVLAVVMMKKEEEDLLSLSASEALLDSFVFDGLDSNDFKLSMEAE